jgi:hypothetical protein
VEKVARQFVTLPCNVVLGGFCAHMTERVKAEINEDSDLIVIPGGMTKLFSFVCCH